MHLFDFIFQSGEFYTEDHSSFLENMLGAFIGAGVALLVFYLETRRERKNRTAANIKIDTDALNYFIALLKSVIGISEKQAEAYGDYSKQLINKPFDQHFLGIVVGEDINRIIHKLDHKQIFHSYLSRFGNDISRIGTFQKIFGRLDYIEATHKKLIKASDNLSEEFIELRIKYRDLADDQIKTFCAELVNEMSQNVPNYQSDKFYQLLNNSLLNYHHNKPSPETIEFLQTSFIDPIKFEIVANFRHNPTAMSIASNCRSATMLYSEIKMRSEGLGFVFANEKTDLIKILVSLKDLSRDMLNDA